MKETVNLGQSKHAALLFFFLVRGGETGRSIEDCDGICVAELLCKWNGIS